MGALPHSQTTNKTINQALLCSDCQFRRCKHSHHGQLLPTNVKSPRAELGGDTTAHQDLSQARNRERPCLRTAGTDYNSQKPPGRGGPLALRLPVSPAFPAADYVSHRPPGSNNQGFLRSRRACSWFLGSASEGVAQKEEILAEQGGPGFATLAGIGGGRGEALEAIASS